MTFSAGRIVVVNFRKFNDSPHWEHVGIYLGSDDFGHWVGVPQGTPMAKPGRETFMETPSVMCFPHDAWHVTSVNHNIGNPLLEYRAYVDMTTVPHWDEPFGRTGALRVRMIDLDLDVIRTHDGRCWVDDEDEFAEHQVLYGYPTDVIAAAQASADAVLAAVRDPETEPYATVAETWMQRFFHLTPWKPLAGAH